MKSTTNVFQEGLRTDLHPLSTSQQVLTDALNATMITYNGNEMMLQNDMGNTLIQDSATGNIMGLSPGFIPIGMKEHGGIMYIASVDKEGKGEIGTIPSPIIRDFYKEKNTYTVNKEIPLGETPIQISNKFYPADKFIVNLNMEIDEDGFKDTYMRLIKNEPTTNPADWQIGRDIWKINTPLNGLGIQTQIITPIISYNHGDEINTLFSNKGIYKLNLYAKNNSLVKASDNLTSALGNGENHWFYHNSKYTFPKDLMEASLSGIQKQFPSNAKPGYLAVSLELESVGSFSALPRTEEPQMVPYIYKSPSNTYYAYFPGFKYTTDSGLYINTLKNIKVIDEQTNNPTKIKAYTKYSTFTDSINELIIDGPYSPIKEPNVPTASISDFGCPEDFLRFNLQEVSQQYISNNEFYISPIVWSIINKAKLKSHHSTDINTFPRLGLFCVDLGHKFNNWYRLELDYYDQFGGKQGHFEQRFNPYLNDVFGTNLSVDGQINGDKLVMGETLTKTLEQQEASNGHTFSYSIGMGKLLSGDYYWGGTTSYASLLSSNQHLKLHSIQTQIKTPQTFIDEEFGDNARYLYNNIKLTDLEYEYQASWGEVTMRGKLISKTSKLIVCKEDGKREKDINVTNQTWYTSLSLSTNTSDSIILSGVDESIVNWDVNVYLPQSTTGGGINYNTPRKLSQKFNDNLISFNSCTLNGSSMEYQLSDQLERINITLGDVHQLNDDNMYTYFRYSDLPSNSGYWTLECPLTVKAIAKPWTISVTSSYSITPYFLLKGTNEEGNSVYVSRFGQTDNTTFTYECNFELDNNGIPYNYLDLSSMPLTQSYKSAYNSYIKSLPRYLYDIANQNIRIIQPLSTADVVQPGIYVLNMTLCPGHSNWIMSGSDPIIDLNITMNGKTYSNITASAYWRMYDDILKFKLDGATTHFSPFYIKNSSGAQVNDIGAYIHPYNPLVLIVRQPSVIQLEFIKKLTGYNFEFQKIGLYRVNSNVPLQQLYEQFSRFTSDIYMYQDYMSLIAKYAAKEPTLAKKYTYTQRFGAFFREGYVFTEGIYNSKSTALNDGYTHPVVESVTIGKIDPYYSIPYIPAEPYVLPVMLEVDSENKVTYSWNTYFMTKLGSDPGFVITNKNGLPTSITATLNDLRTTN